METNFVGNYEFVSYQNVCIYKIVWRIVNTIATCTVLNPILLERAGH